jgi:hypothetical protein
MLVRLDVEGPRPSHRPRENPDPGRRQASSRLKRAVVNSAVPLPVRYLESPDTIQPSSLALSFAAVQARARNRGKLTLRFWSSFFLAEKELAMS